jgi:2-hydroxy-4-carboxymuconate semialdehyde hemiacetal dehydrogenase
MNDAADVAPYHARRAAADGSDQRPVGVVLLGYGAIAAMHVTALRAAGARIEAVAGPRARELEGFAAEHGIPVAVTDVQAAIEHAGVEAVVIASPTQTHVAQATLALEADRDVLVEIPVATSLAEAERLVALADDVERILAVCHTLRYWRPIQDLHTGLGTRGWQPTHVVARSLSLRHADVGWTGRQRSWVDDLLWHHGGHVVDEVLTLLGSEVVEVASTSGPVWDTSGKPMDHAISLRTADGRIATIALSYHARIGASEYLVIGEDGTVLLEDGVVRWSDGTGSGPVDAAAVQQAAVAAQDGDFLAAVRRGMPTADGSWTDADARSILPTLRVLQAVSDRASRTDDTMASAPAATRAESDPTARNE